MGTFNVTLSGVVFRTRSTLACHVREHGPLMTRPGSCCVHMCVPGGRPEHGTTRTSVAQNPGTQAAGLDYYRNLTVAHFLHCRSCRCSRGPIGSGTWPRTLICSSRVSARAGTGALATQFSSYRSFGLDYADRAQAGPVPLRAGRWTVAPNHYRIVCSSVLAHTASDEEHGTASSGDL